jgi:L-2,4-diaminobutyric acid acetyltransferase
MWAMARDSGALDLNSPYAYVLAGKHFADTSLVAVDDEGALAGFVTAYRPPSEPDAVFVWQVAVDPSRRGSGIGRRLLHEVIDRAVPLGARSLTATVTPSNEASRRLFQAVAADRGAGYEEQPLFDAALFPGEGHEPEHRILITPV